MSSKLTETQLKEWAKLLYLSHNENIKNIHEKTGIEEAQLRDWIRDGNWDNLKRSLVTTKHEQLQLLYDTLYTITTRLKIDEGKEDLKDIEKILKLTASIKNLQTELSTGEIIEVAIAYLDWLRKEAPDAVKTETMHLDRFINYWDQKK